MRSLTCRGRGHLGSNPQPKDAIAAATWQMQTRSLVDLPELFRLRQVTSVFVVIVIVINIISSNSSSSSSITFLLPLFNDSCRLCQFVVYISPSSGVCLLCGQAIQNRLELRKLSVEQSLQSGRSLLNDSNTEPSHG